MNTKKSKYLEFVDVAVQVSRILPDHSNKFAKKNIHPETINDFIHSETEIKTKL